MTESRDGGRMYVSVFGGGGLREGKYKEKFQIFFHGPKIFPKIKIARNFSPEFAKSSDLTVSTSALLTET